MRWSAIRVIGQRAAGTRRPLTACRRKLDPCHERTLRKDVDGQSAAKGTISAGETLQRPRPSASGHVAAADRGAGDRVLSSTAASTKRPRDVGYGEFRRSSSKDNIAKAEIQGPKVYGEFPKSALATQQPSRTNDGKKLSKEFVTTIAHVRAAGSGARSTNCLRSRSERQLRRPRSRATTRACCWSSTCW